MASLPTTREWRINVLDAPHQAIAFGGWVLQQTHNSGVLRAPMKTTKSDRAFQLRDNPDALRPGTSRKDRDGGLDHAKESAELERAVL